MKNIIFALPGNMVLATSLSEKLGCDLGLIELRDFPDGESYLRVDSEVTHKTVIIVAGLDHPNCKLFPLMLLAQTLKKLGAKKIFLVSPYLPYMRQDKQFLPGEAVNAIIFAKFLSGFIDGLITIDPHLHRIQQLSEIYTIPEIFTLHVTHEISDWIRGHVKSPLIIGPDEESRQWVATIAHEANAPFSIIKKIRYGDRKVSITIDDLQETDRTPVLVDDIISTGTSMLAAMEQLLAKGFKDPICIGIHALFSDHDYQELLHHGAKTVITCNTVIHPSNQIDVTDRIVQCLSEVL